MKGHGFSEDDWEKADAWHNAKCDRLAEQEEKRTMSPLSPRNALDVLEYCLDKCANDPTVQEAIAVLAITLEQHRELESITADLVKWFTDPPDCPLFDLVNRARAYHEKEPLK